MNIAKTLVTGLGLLTVLTLALIAQPADSTAARASIQAYTPDAFLRFGTYLMEQRDYRRAATEFERYLFLHADQPLPRLRYRVGLCYFRLGELDRAGRYFGEAFQRTEDSGLQDSLRWSLIAVYLRQGGNSRVLDLLGNPGSVQKDPERSGRFRLYRALYFLQMENWSKVTAVVNDPTAASAAKYQTAFKRIRQLAERGEHLPHKSPLKAAVLSAIIPGSGKFYVGREQDGLYALFLIAGSAFLSYRGYRNHGVAHFQTIFFGSAAGILYLGNVYGSAIAAKLYNRQAKLKLREEIESEIYRWTDL
ncbi:MAG: tetratricopeptide repeat protein [Calditrichaeota bacterium]|nr:tetratricopeptide repeat protein [Calditrichota bacterium]